MKTWTVTFVGDYFAMTTVIQANTRRKAEKEAIQLLRDYYGWEMTELSNEITVDEA